MSQTAVLTQGINTLAYPIENIAIDRDRIRADYETVVAASSWRKQNVFMNPGWEGIALFSLSGRSDDLTHVRHTPVQRTPAGSTLPLYLRGDRPSAVRRTLASCGVLQARGGQKDR